MGLFDKIGSKRATPPKDATYKITQEGRDKLQEFTGDAEGRVLVALETHGSSNVDEIAATSGLGRGQVERIVPRLLRNGKVQIVSGSMGQEIEMGGDSD